MLLKKIFGTLILILNIAGLGYLIYIGALYLWNTYVADDTESIEPEATPAKKPKPSIVNDDIVLDDDDLLKDMDLSDLDDLDLDEFD